MKNKTFQFLIIILFIFSSCKKDPILTLPEEAETKPDSVNYHPLNEGDYWIYNYNKIDTLGNVTLIRQDSVVISGDTIIDGKQYFIKAYYWNGYKNHERYLRDSSGYIVNPEGDIYWSLKQYNDTLSTSDHEFFSTYTITRGKMKWIQVPAGKFRVLTKATIYRSDSFIFPFTNSNIDSAYAQYANHVGFVKSESHYMMASQGNVFRKELIRFNIEK